MKPLDEQQQKLIDKYLEGRLSDDDQQDFQQQIQQEDFAAEVQFQESLQGAVQKLAKEEHPLKKRFQGEEKKIKDGTAGASPKLPHFTSKQERPRPIRQYMNMAAGLAILAFIIYQLVPFLFPSTVETEFPIAAIKSLERPPQITQIIKSDQNQALESMAIDCITLFKAENQYPAALSCFQSLNEQYTTPEIRYYIAHSFFHLGQYESAVPIYDELLQSSDIKDDQIHDQIRLNRLLSLVLLKEAGYQEELDEIMQDNSFKYLREAQKLQEMLKG
ncbi:MAG: hypothetical protein KTR30_03670 [Saprospiraceae bacterium]|nr:hypothetical protein [Saprospiraceae bacterium]